MHDHNIERFTKFGTTEQRDEKMLNIQNAIRFSLVQYPVIGIIGLLIGLNWAKVILSNDSLLSWEPEFKPMNSEDYLQIIDKFKLLDEENVFKLLKRVKEKFRKTVEKKNDKLPDLLELYKQFITNLHPDSKEVKTNIGNTADERTIKRIAQGKIVLDFLQFRVHQEFKKNTMTKCDSCQWLNCFATIHYSEINQEESFNLWLTYLDFAKLADEFVASNFLLFVYE